MRKEHEKKPIDTDDVDEFVALANERKQAEAHAQHVLDAWKAISKVNEMRQARAKAEAEEARRRERETPEAEQQAEDSPAPSADESASTDAEQGESEDASAMEGASVSEEGESVPNDAESVHESTESVPEAEGKADVETKTDTKVTDNGTTETDNKTKIADGTYSLLDVVRILYSKGKEVASKLFSMKFFDVATTPKFMKELGLRGDKFTIKYGVIARHIGKDGSHKLSERDWEQLPQALQNPFAISKLTDKENSYRIYTTLQTASGEFAVVGVDVKNAGREIEVNAVSTVFGRRNNANLPENEEVIYRSNEITPEQSSLLKRPNFAQYPTEQELSAHKDTPSAETSQTNKQENQEQSAEKPTLREQRADEGAQSVSAEEADLRDALADVVQRSGAPVMMNESAQRVLDEANGKNLTKGLRLALEDTENGTENAPTAISNNADLSRGSEINSITDAKVDNRIEVTKENAENLSNLANFIQKDGALKPEDFLLAVESELGSTNTNPDSSQYFKNDINYTLRLAKLPPWRSRRGSRPCGQRGDGALRLAPAVRGAFRHIP